MCQSVSRHSVFVNVQHIAAWMMMDTTHFCPPFAPQHLSEPSTLTHTMAHRGSRHWEIGFCPRMQLPVFSTGPPALCFAIKNKQILKKNRRHTFLGMHEVG